MRCRSDRAVTERPKVLLVLDQFEQWLHAKRSEQHTELVQALRQCDGEHVQCLVLVRDDFGMAATRFMRELEVRIVEGHNFATVDLFDPRPRPQGAGGVRPGLRPAARQPGRADARAGAVPRPGGRRAGPGRQGHLGAAGPVRRDGQGQAVDAGHAAGGRRHRGGRRHLPGRDVQRGHGPAAAPAAPEGGPGGAEGAAARTGDRHQGAHAVAPGAAGRVGLRRPPAGLRRPAAHPGHRAPADDADRPGRGLRGGTARCRPGRPAPPTS